MATARPNPKDARLFINLTPFIPRSFLKERGKIISLRGALAPLKHPDYRSKVRRGIGW